MAPLQKDSWRNEVDADDETDFAAKPPMGFTVALIAGLHVLCCGLMLPLLAGVSLASILPSRPAMGVIAALLGMVGFVWYVRKGRAKWSAGRNSCKVERTLERE